MKVEQSTTFRDINSAPKTINVVRPLPKTQATKIGDKVLSLLPDQSPCVLSRAPICLDVMGGVADHWNGPVLSICVADHLCVAAQPRSDQQIVITCGKSLVEGEPVTTVLQSSWLEKSDPGLLPLNVSYNIVSNNGKASEGGEVSCNGKAPGLTDVILCVIGTLVELRRQGMDVRSLGGLSLSVGSTADGCIAIGAYSSLVAGVFAAMTELTDQQPAPYGIRRLCRQVEHKWLGTPVGGADTLCALWSEPESLMMVEGLAETLPSSMILPEGVSLLGVQCGPKRPDWLEKCNYVRTCIAMGHLALSRLLDKEHADSSLCNGCLTSITKEAYVKRFRDRLPVKLKGRDFTRLYGEIGDPLIDIGENQIYKLRSRTEHQIYENERAREFRKLLTRAPDQAGQDETQALREAGLLMYSSHWSYGQRCGLGTPESDTFITLIRKQASSDIFGAKISGLGVEGLVVVLFRDTGPARDAIDDVFRKFESETGIKLIRLTGSSAGALIDGVQHI